MSPARVRATAGRPADAPPAQDEQRVRARYLVGADGGRSVVRTQLGIGMTGQNFPNPWLVVDIKAKNPEDGLRHLPYFNFICDPACPTVSCVQPNGHHRFEFMLMPGQTREHMEHPDTVRHYLSKYIDVDKFEVLRKLVYTFNALMAEKWREGRVLLAGDAAHMTPQFIGQGMNAGVRDAYNLAWKLDAVLRGQAGEALLDSYEAERKPHAAAMTREGIRMKDFVSMVNPLGTALRNALTRVLTRLPGIGPFVCRGDFIPKPSYRAGSYLGLPRRAWRGAEGRLMPQPLLRGPDGRRRGSTTWRATASCWWAPAATRATAWTTRALRCGVRSVRGSSRCTPSAAGRPATAWRLPRPRGWSRPRTRTAASTAGCAPAAAAADRWWCCGRTASSSRWCVPRRCPKPRASWRASCTVPRPRPRTSRDPRSPPGRMEVA